MPRNIFRPGALRHRVTLEAPDSTADGGGGATITWSEVTALWAAIEPAAGRDAAVADRVTNEITHDVALRYRTGLTAGHRFVDGARIFDILSVTDPDERKAWLLCRCRERRP